MSDPFATSHAAACDEALLSRVQQENQKQIFGKLLHDLRNPIHSIRITMELFARLARREGDVEALMQRAAAYLGPAQSALENLLGNSERLGNYIAPATSPVIAPLPVKSWVEEIALLLRASRNTMSVAVPVETDPELHLLADRPRLSHATLYCCLRNTSSQVALRVREAPDRFASINVSFAASGQAPAHGAGSLPPCAQEMRVLIENAGGALIAAEDGSVSMRFRRSPS